MGKKLEEDRVQEKEGKKAERKHRREVEARGKE